jgi:hypothetical protein
MSTSRAVTAVCTLTLLVCMSASVLVARRIDVAREATALQDVLWIPSADTVKRMSLGYSGLLADIYWTRVVQYFGGRHSAGAMHYESLEPLLNIATELDPKLFPAYEFGGVFLAQRPPQGAGDPQAAANLVEKGIRNNPDSWRLYYSLGFIYWMEMKDLSKASDAFERGSKVPGAHPWMAVMAAALAQHAGERQTARYLWTNILKSTQDKTMQENARNRLAALDIDEYIDRLQERVNRYIQATGRNPSSFEQMRNEGYIRGIPRDPKGRPFEILNGHVEIANYKEYPFITRGLPLGTEASGLPKLPSK